MTGCSANDFERFVTGSDSDRLDCWYDWFCDDSERLTKTNRLLPAIAAAYGVFGPALFVARVMMSHNPGCGDRGATFFEATRFAAYESSRKTGTLNITIEELAWLNDDNTVCSTEYSLCAYPAGCKSRKAFERRFAEGATVEELAARIAALSLDEVLQEVAKAPTTMPQNSELPAEIQVDLGRREGFRFTASLAPCNWMYNDELRVVVEMSAEDGQVLDQEFVSGERPYDESSRDEFDTLAEQAVAALLQRTVEGGTQG